MWYIISELKESKAKSKSEAQNVGFHREPQRFKMEFERAGFWQAIDHMGKTLDDRLERFAMLN